MGDELAKLPDVMELTPAEYRDLTDEEKKELALAADRDLRMYFHRLNDAEVELWPDIRKIEDINGAIATLSERRAELLAKNEAERKPYLFRAWQKLNRVVSWRNLVTAFQTKPAATLSLSTGDVKFAKNRVKTEWVEKGDIIPALQAADLPLEALQQAQRMEVKPNLKWIGEHLEDRDDGTQWFVWTDVETGEKTEREVYVTTGEGESAQRSNLRRTVQPEREFEVTATPREAHDGD